MRRFEYGPRGCTCPTGQSCYEDCPPEARLSVMPNVGPWEPTPWYWFWRARMRRQTWRLYDGTDRDSPGNMWIKCFEYQHPAFVAREILEDKFAPRT